MKYEDLSAIFDAAILTTDKQRANPYVRTYILDWNAQFVFCEDVIRLNRRWRRALRVRRMWAKAGL